MSFNILIVSHNLVLKRWILAVHLLSLNVAIEAFDAHGLRGQVCENAISIQYATFLVLKVKVKMLSVSNICQHFWSLMNDDFDRRALILITGSSERENAGRFRYSGHSLEPLWNYFGKEWKSSSLWTCEVSFFHSSSKISSCSNFRTCKALIFPRTHSHFISDSETE